jgi:GNAT superfamily N-acetyltransferase
MSIEIREAAEEDLQHILNLYAVEDIDNGNLLTLGQARQIFNKMRTYPNYKIYIAILENEIVGTFSLAIMDNLAHLGKSTGLVEDVVVAVNYRSQGIGKAMMEHAMQICKQQNCYKMCLSSNVKRERAHHFYENLGFQKHGYSFKVDF